MWVSFSVGAKILGSSEFLWAITRRVEFEASISFRLEPQRIECRQVQLVLIFLILQPLNVSRW